MYKKVKLADRVRVPPQELKGEVKDAVKATIKNDYEGKLEKGVGLLLALLDIENVGEGTIVPGDGAVYYKTTFNMLAWEPVMHEVLEGEVSEIAEFGAFIRIGPIDGLVHISQVMDDYVSYSKSGALIGKESGRSLKKGDRVRAKIVAISLKSLETAKIGMTMRQPGLGKGDWLEKEREEEKKPEGETEEEE